MVGAIKTRAVVVVVVVGVCDVVAESGAATAVICRCGVAISKIIGELMHG